MYRCGTLLHIGHAYKYSVRLCIHVRNYGVCFFNMKQIHFIIFLLCIKGIGKAKMNFYRISD